MPILALQRRFGQFAKRARQLDAGRAAADDDEARQRLHLGRIAAAFRPVEGFQDAAADLQRVGQCFERRRVLRPLVMAEPGIDRARRQEEVVVRDRPGVADEHLACDLVDAGDLAEDDRHVRIFAEQRADRRGDIGRRERGGRDLVEQRLKEVMVGAIDQHQVDVILHEMMCGLEAAEAAADDDDPGLLPGDPRKKRRFNIRCHAQSSRWRSNGVR